MQGNEKNLGSSAFPVDLNYKGFKSTGNDRGLEDE
jgi:hypothetical protein